MSTSARSGQVELEQAFARERERMYRRLLSRRVRSMDEAARFVDTVGFSLLFASTQGVELPSLFEAIKGKRNMHIEDWDADADRLWAWKNELPAAKRAYYGKALAGGRPALVSLKMFPYLYAQSALEDVEADYFRGRVSYEAKRVYDALQSLGPTPTMALRRAAGFDRPGDSQRYHHALDELQRNLVIAPVGATIETGAWASQIFELVARWFPRQVERAQRIEAQAARRALAKRYLQTVHAAQPAMLTRVFGWSHEQAKDTLAELLSRGAAKKKGDWFLYHE